MARDAYWYCYLPMIAGIILFALGAEQVVSQITSPHIPNFEPAHGPGDSLLFGGCLYLCGAPIGYRSRLGCTGEFGASGG